MELRGPEPNDPTDDNIMFAVAVIAAIAVTVVLIIGLGMWPWDLPA